MGGILSYSGIVTKARAMEARLLSRTDYEKIAALEKVADFINFLKGREGYKELFAGKDEQSFRRNEIEELLNYSIYRDYAKLYRFANQNQRKAMQFIFWRIEADILKKGLHKIEAGKDLSELAVFETFFHEYSSVDVEAIKQASNVAEFAAALKGSAYEKLIKKLEQENALNIRAMEEQLDIFCFLRIWNSIQKEFAGQEKRALLDVYGRQIDLLNILWIYRVKKYYNGDGLNRRPATIPVYYKLKKKELETLVECYTTEDFLHVLEKTYYSEIKNEASVENFYRDNVAHAYRENKKKYPYSMSSIYNMLYYKEREIDRLTTALECIRYRLDAETAMRYILQE
ncbi:MAG: V-type ATPase subunit [Acetatifactor sp.]|nr:V-type ATPase subunit [Acetatifactor sp.]